MKKDFDFNNELIGFIKLGALFIIIVIGYYLINFAHLGISNDQEVWAQFGDYFGGILNPIFAFLAFIALLITIKLQNEALQTSKDELKASREELEKSRKAQEEQSKSLELQNEATKLQIFENTFFKLLELFINSKNNISFRPSGLITFEAGNQKFILFGKKYISKKTIFYNENLVNGNTAISKLLLILKNCYNSYELFNGVFEIKTASYFGQIYQIIKFIDESEIINKQRYINIFRAQFTKNELEFLFYHCLGEIGKRRFKGLVEKYEFFEHITHNEDIEKPLKEYHIKAFGKNQVLIDKYNGVNES